MATTVKRLRSTLTSQIFSRISQKFVNKFNSSRQRIDIVVQRSEWYCLHIVGSNTIDVRQFDVARDKSQILSIIELVVDVDKTENGKSISISDDWRTPRFDCYSLIIDHENGICINHGQRDFIHFTAGRSNDFVHFLIECAQIAAARTHLQ